MTVNHPTFGIMCEICFKQLTPKTCAVDTDGQLWDVCPGQCATDAGITEGQLDAGHVTEHELIQLDD